MYELTKDEPVSSALKFANTRDIKLDLHYINRLTNRCPVPRKSKYFSYLQVVNHKLIT